MSEAGTVTPTVSEAAQKGFLARVVGVFFAPGETFTDVARKPTILAPLLLLMLLQGLVTFMLAPAQGADAASFMENSEFIQRQLAQLPDEQRAQILEDQRNPSTAKRIQGAVAGALFIVAALAVISLIFWGVGTLLGGEPTFKKAFSMLLFSGMLLFAANSLIKMPLMIAKNTVAGVTFGPAMFLPDLEVTSKLYRILSNFDVFVLWGVIVIGIGLAKISKISTGKGITTSVIFWGMLAALGYFITGILS